MSHPLIPAALLWGAWGLLTATSLPAQTPTVGIRGVTVVNVANGSLLRDQTVLVTGNRIVSIGARAQVAIPDGTEVIAGEGKFLIPGLWDMHVHAHDDLDVATTVYYPLFIANGITGVRDVWGSRMVGDAARAAVTAGKLPGPRSIVAGALIDGPGRMSPAALIAVTPEDGRRLVDSLHAAGAPFLKLYNSFLPETFFAIAERARALGIPFVGHLPGAVRAADASDAGLHSIEHVGAVRACSTGEDEAIARVRAGIARIMGGDTALANLWRMRRGVDEGLEALARPDDERCRALAARLAKNGTAMVPTLTIGRGITELAELAAGGDPRLVYVPRHLRYTWTPANNPVLGRVPPQWIERERVRQRRAREVLRLMHEAGVLLLAGTDLGMPFVFAGFSLHEDLELLVQAGLTPLHALQTATLNPARFLDRSEELGTVAAGKLADLVLLDANPLEDITNIRRIHAVVADGRLYRRAQLDSLLARAARTSIADVISAALERDGAAAARARSRALHTSRPDSLRFGEYELSILGYELLRANRVAEAIVVFEMNVEAYPEAPNPWDSLGDALLVRGDRGAASDAFTRAVVLAEQHQHPMLARFRSKLDSVKQN
jgi:imidazolonepropionase-like amidohydrolase